MVDLNLKLPPAFFEEEVRDGYTVTREKKELWAVLLDLLQEFGRVCEKNNIVWYADAGTILGAVRHKGFIPWDDDIDVMLLRPEYEKLCKIASKEFKKPYFFQTEETDHGCFRGHAQLRNSLTTGILASEKGIKYKRFNQGIFLDIFPLDDLPQNREDLEVLCKKTTELKARSCYYYTLAHDIHLEYCYRFKILELLRCAKHIFFTQPKYDKLSKLTYSELEDCYVSYSDSKSEYVGKLCLPPFKKRRIWKRDWFSSVVFLPFEDMVIPVPCGYQDLLTTFYGEWQKFVIGASSHGETFFDVNKPYNTYFE